MGMKALEASVQKLEKVSRVVQRMDDERRAVHSCTALQGPLCKQWPRERPPVRSQLECEDAKLEPAALRAGPGPASLPIYLGPQPHKVLCCCTVAHFRGKVQHILPGTQ